ITPRPVCYTLTVSHTGNGSNPSASPANSEGCPAGKYVAGASIALSGAAPASGWQISGWTGTNDDSSTASTNTVTMPASAHTASVIYTEIPPTCYALTLSHTGSGSDPTANPTHSTGCAEGQYVAGESISLSGAVPVSGWQISGWTGTNNNSSTASTNTVTMPASAHTASVIYTQIEYILTVNIVGNGSVNRDKPAPYYLNDEVTLSAVADPGWTFAGWSGAGCSGTGTCTVTMDADKEVTATFTQIPNNPPVITEGESTSIIMTDVFTLTLHAEDLDGDVLTWSISTPAQHGTAEASGKGYSKVIGYIPNPGYTGDDSFVVRVEDTKGGYDTITVNVTINPVEVFFYVYMPLIIK
ncbi:MAG: hypothetical protein GYA34_13410, partial [Chloroflexi bacterium]|nr:hypothetical protein [Chloroflexota bacterium]